ncbi:MAG TPA: F0F1 ATP synthase subunit A [Candidatus Eisenbacteria bacterium]|jgi:F-type H+-transporting ATPase subunit a
MKTFLARVRRATIVLAAVAAIAGATYASLPSGLAVAAGAAWSLVNLLLLETLVRAATTPGTEPASVARRAGWALGGMALLLAAGAWLLFHTPALWLVAGFSLPFAVMVLKAVSHALLESRAWRALVRSPWRATAVVAALILAAWWLAPSGSRGERAAGDTAGAPAASGDVAGGHETPAAEGAAEGHTEGAAATGEAAEAKEESGTQKFPNVITLIVNANRGAPWAHTLHFWEPVVFALAVGLLVCGAGFFASRNPRMIPGGFQNGAEALVEALYNFVGGILGPTHGRRFFPLLASLFLYIFAMNLFGLLPLMDSPTSNLNVTFALGFTVFVYVQYVGIRSLGIVGYVDHMLGNPRTVTGWILAPLMLPIHVLGELAKPISLSCRLFGNIFGEDMLLVGFASLGISMLSFTHLPVGVPLHAIFYPLALLTSTLQAFVFTVLTTIYILLMLPHESHGHEGEAQHAH